jgi:hypothetical protein
MTQRLRRSATTTKTGTRDDEALWADLAGLFRFDFFLKHDALHLCERPANILETMPILEAGAYRLHLPSDPDRGADLDLVPA